MSGDGLDAQSAVGWCGQPRIRETIRVFLLMDRAASRAFQGKKGPGDGAFSEAWSASPESKPVKERSRQIDCVRVAIYNLVQQPSRVNSSQLTRPFLRICELYI